ncbi:uncharacterized protein BP5553_06031 [Venustampulla echinocandica]|uniref:Amidohydrolase-related domain-containing protein n=1 Tax=Venustampulla echinocandica TaxID=2656787 RepID=A0A370TMC6_9HELO|nr:uncharacterized protein BP5553_06031 [Venustampulla echinocandica]RDL36679.1 hypothetical protein BP5553_06031 [Venustampulla echinocandica]
MDNQGQTTSQSAGGGSSIESFNRIDTHAHFLPDFYRDALLDAGITKPDGMLAIPPWNEEDHVDFMDASRISKSYLSISTPGVYFGDIDKAKKPARKVNEHAADVASKNNRSVTSLASSLDCTEDVYPEVSPNKTRPDWAVLSALVKIWDPPVMP